MFRRLTHRFGGRYALGPLETELLRRLWSRGHATVRELLDGGGLDAAYTTVMTTLDRLYKKRVLERSLEGKAFRYRPRQTQHEYSRDAIAHALRTLLGHSRDGALPISLLVDAVSEQDARGLDELARAVEEKRRALKRKEDRR